MNRIFKISEHRRRDIQCWFIILFNRIQKHSGESFFIAEKDENFTVVEAY